MLFVGLKPDRAVPEHPTLNENRPLDAGSLLGAAAVAATRGTGMRVLLWYWGRRGAGAQIALAMAAALIRRRDTSVCLSVSRQCELIDGFRNLELPRLEVDTYRSLGGFVLGLARVPLLASRLVQLARDWRADSVVSVMTHTWTPLVAPGLARAGIAFVPVVHDVRPHLGDNGFLWDWRLRTELASARAVFTLSSHVEAELHRCYPAIPVLRLPLGAFFPVVEKVPHQCGKFRFLFFGRLRTYKGLDLLRDAFRLLVVRRPEARLYVVGEGDALALAPGLDAVPGVVLSTRWVPEAAIGETMANADAIVVPYREASQSGVISAAFVAGLPVVATSVGAIPEQVMPGVDALIAAAVTPEALADAMERMMDPETYCALLIGAAASGRRLNNWDLHASKLVEGLRHVGLFHGAA